MAQLTADLNAADFRAWLTQSRDLVCGRPRYVCDCPISNWLRSLGYERVLVGQGIAWFEAGAVALPDWAMAFVDMFDNTFICSDPVTGREALGVLDEIAGGEDA